MLAAMPERVRPFTMEEYDELGLDYANNLSPDVEKYMTPFTINSGWPKGGPNPENPRDRARQENAQLASAEKGEALLSIHIRHVAYKLQSMFDANENGDQWPPSG